MVFIRFHYVGLAVDLSFFFIRRFLLHFVLFVFPPLFFAVLVLLASIVSPRFYTVLLFYWVLLGFTGFELGLTWFYLDELGFP